MRFLLLIVFLAVDPVYATTTKCAGLIARFQESQAKKEVAVLGATTDEVYILTWNIFPGGEEPHMQAKFVRRSDQQKFFVTAFVNDQGRQGIHKIELNLPRTALEDEYIDWTLGSAALQKILSQASPTDQFEIVIEDPTIVKLLNQRVRNIMQRKGWEVQEIPPEIVVEQDGRDSRSRSFFPLALESKRGEKIKMFREGLEQPALWEDLGDVGLFNMFTANAKNGWGYSIKFDFEKLETVDETNFEEAMRLHFRYKVVFKHE